MKRIFLILLTLNTAFFPLSCTQSREVRTLDDVIADIGEVTLASEEAIVEAEAMYDALSEEEQANLKKAKDLLKARETLDKLKEEALVQSLRDSLAGDWEELSDSLPILRPITSWFGGLSLDADGTYRSETASSTWEPYEDEDGMYLVLQGSRGKTTLDVIHDGKYTKLVARELKLTFLRSNEMADYIKERFVLVHLTAENVADYIGEPVCVGEILDEKDKKTGERAWIQPSPAYEKGLVYYGQGEDFNYVLRQTWGNGYRTVVIPYDTLPLASSAGFGAVAEVSGTVIYVRSEFVAENRMTDARTRMLTFTDGTTHTTSLTWYSDLADYQDWLL